MGLCVCRHSHYFIVKVFDFRFSDFFFIFGSSYPFLPFVLQHIFSRLSLNSWKYGIWMTQWHKCWCADYRYDNMCCTRVTQNKKKCVTTKKKKWNQHWTVQKTVVAEGRKKITSTTMTMTWISYVLQNSHPPESWNGMVKFIYTSSTKNYIYVIYWRCQATVKKETRLIRMLVYISKNFQTLA